MPDSRWAGDPSLEDVCGQLATLLELPAAEAENLLGELEGHRRVDGAGDSSEASARQAERCATLLSCRDQASAGGHPSGEDWKAAFERICGVVTVAEGLETGALRELVAESEELMKTIQEFEIPEAKIYLFRLEKCKQMFEFLLELREE